MPRIYVDFARLDQIGNRCKTIASKVDAVQSDLQHTIRQLDWDVRFESNINSTANQIARKLEQYSNVLEAYQRFIEDAKSEYVKLDEYKKFDFVSAKTIDLHIVGPGGRPDFNWKDLDFDWKDLIKAFGSAGSVFGIVNSIFGAKSWVDWGNIGVSATKTIASIAKDYNNYTKIGRAIGTTNATGYFWRNFFGFNKVGYASIASSASARFYNNLHNSTSPYKLSSIFDSFTGKNGVVSSVASWAGLALSGAANWFSNVEEQKESNGTMSTGRVVAETVSETIIDTVLATAGSAVVGAAIATVTGSVAAPAVVAVATGGALALINAGVKALTATDTSPGKTATEWVSDAILNTASDVGSAVDDGAKAVANWLSKLSFA